MDWVAGGGRIEGNNEEGTKKEKGVCANLAFNFMLH